MKLREDIVQRQLDEYRVDFEAGSADALMHALMFCAKNKLVMPDWVDLELHQAWHRFINRTADDLGTAFGITWPKGKHKAAYLKKRRLQFAVYFRAVELLRQNRSIDESLFADIGRELGIGKRLVSEYYYSAKALSEHRPAIGLEMLLDPYVLKTTKKNG